MDKPANHRPAPSTNEERGSLLDRLDLDVRRKALRVRGMRLFVALLDTSTEADEQAFLDQMKNSSR